MARFFMQLVIGFVMGAAVVSQLVQDFGHFFEVIK